MKAIIHLILLLLLPGIFFCESGKNSTDPFPDNSHLTIKTNKDVYSWQTGKSVLSIVIEGSLNNKTNTTFYAQLGDGFGTAEQDKLLFAKNSGGFLEKYDSRTSQWIETDLQAMLIEGSRVVPIKPAEDYVIHAYLTTTMSDKKGKHRLRVDYYIQQNSEEWETPFHAYSNIFEIR